MVISRGGTTIPNSVWRVRRGRDGDIPLRRETQRTSGLCGGLCYGGYGRGDTSGGYAVEQGIRHLTVHPAVARGMPANRPQPARGARWAYARYDPPSDSQRPSMGKRKGRHKAAQFGLS